MADDVNVTVRVDFLGACDKLAQRDAYGAGGVDGGVFFGLADVDKLNALRNLSNLHSFHKPQPYSVFMANRKARPPQWVFHVRRAVALAILLLIVIIPVRACGGPKEEPEVVAPELPPAHVAASDPTALSIPSVGLNASFEKGPCRLIDGTVDPASLSKACVFTDPSKPYELPGSDAGDIVVIAGHAAAGVPAVFDKLYNPSAEAHTVAVGDAMYLRTEASGKWWLKYQATDLHEPSKDALAGDAAIWGEAAVPGRLLTITCIQPANPFKEAVSNAVVGWQFVGVVGQGDVVG